jgi:hypothetical protein
MRAPIRLRAGVVCLHAKETALKCCDSEAVATSKKTQLGKPSCS